MARKATMFSAKLENEQLTEEMNILGKEGWELVTSIDHATAGRSKSIVLILSGQ